jgi:hypothetical protein
LVNLFLLIILFIGLPPLAAVKKLPVSTSKTTLNHGAKLDIFLIYNQNIVINFQTRITKTKNPAEIAGFLSKV